jgi:hypothetical protein
MHHRALPFLLLAATAAPAAAQRRAAEPAVAARLEASAAPSASAAAPAASTPGARARGASAGRSVVGMLGGALIGAGAGYLTSQVAWSDWDKSSNSEFRSRRLSFTLGGSALGAVTGLIVGRGTSGAGGVQRPAVMPGRTVSRTSIITEEEVRASTATNLYQLVQALRPHWLRREGASGHTNPNPDDPNAVASTSDDTGVKVYVERGLVGDIFSLRQLAVADVTSLEFLDTAAATYRLGSGNPSGAIIVHTGRRR